MLQLRNFILFFMLVFIVRADDTSITTPDSTKQSSATVATEVTTGPTVAPVVTTGPTVAPVVTTGPTVAPVVTTGPTVAPIVTTQQIQPTSPVPFQQSTAATEDFEILTSEGNLDNNSTTTPTTIIPPPTDDDDSSNLALILGLSLGIGIPVLIGLIALIYYLAVYKPKKRKVVPVNASENKTIGAVTEVPLKPIKKDAKKTEPSTEF